ncbi:lipopolysaccharide biosynthesis protein [Leifsonia sp. YIM 134122]|uniref:Lipopolysaccharide biosynthesis protein n=1 Tax=Leifsonia stereocauli TaxID=3134136 RepID=A0ABU9W7L9_9MICO
MSESGAPPGDGSSGLGARAARGAAVTVGGQGIRILIQVVSVVTLARLLSPQDYGLVAMVLAVVGVAEIFRDFGLSSAAVQVPLLSRGQRDNLFWINTGLGVVLAGIALLAAPLVGLLYREPDVVALTQVLSLTFVLNGLAAQYRADRNRQLKFAVLALSDVGGAAIGLGVAISTALLGWGYWALAAQQLTQGLVALVVLVGSARWLPRLPDRSADVRGLLRFGWHLVGTQLVGYITNNIDSVIVGVRFGAAQLGIYSRGFQLLMQPLGQLRAPTTTVALPVLSRLQNDPARYDEFLVRGQQALGYTLVAGLGVVVAAADPLVAILLGPQWQEVVPILRILAAAGAFQTLAYVGYWVYLSRALTSDLLRYSMVTSVVKIACILIGSYWGIIGVAIGYAAGPAIAWPISIIWLSTRTTIPARRLVLGALRMLAVATVAAGAGWLAAVASTALGVVAEAAIAIGVTLAVYAIIALIIPPVRRDVAGIIAIMRLVPAARRGRSA